MFGFCYIYFCSVWILLNLGYICILIKMKGSGPIVEAIIHTRAGYDI